MLYSRSRVLDSGWTGGRDDWTSSGSADGEGERGGVAEDIVEQEGTERKPTSARLGLYPSVERHSEPGDASRVIDKLNEFNVQRSPITRRPNAFKQ